MDSPAGSGRWARCGGFPAGNSRGEGTGLIRGFRAAPGRPVKPGDDGEGLGRALTGRGEGDDEKGGGTVTGKGRDPGNCLVSGGAVPA